MLVVLSRPPDPIRDIPLSVRFFSIQTVLFRFHIFIYYSCSLYFRFYFYFRFILFSFLVFSFHVFERKMMAFRKMSCKQLTANRSKIQSTSTVANGDNATTESCDKSSKIVDSEFVSDTFHTSEKDLEEVKAGMKMLGIDTLATQTNANGKEIYVLLNISQMILNVIAAALFVSMISIVIPASFSSSSISSSSSFTSSHLR